MSLSLEKMCTIVNCRNITWTRNSECWMRLYLHFLEKSLVVRSRLFGFSSKSLTDFGWQCYSFVFFVFCHYINCIVIVCICRLDSFMFMSTLCLIFLCGLFPFAFNKTGETAHVVYSLPSLTLSGNSPDGQECIISELSLQEVWERHTQPPTEQRPQCETVNNCRYLVLWEL